MTYEDRYKQERCRTCYYYRRLHCGGPKTYGSCFYAPPGLSPESRKVAYPVKVVHGNAKACARWESATIRRTRHE